MSILRGVTGELRASDRDREIVADQLRKNCVEGRLTLEELEERLEGAMAAVTVAELSGYVSDLPARAEPPSHVPSKTAAPPRPGPVGVLPFTHHVVAPVAREEVHWQVLCTIAPPLADYGYELITQSPTGFVFECHSRPPWTILVAIIGFPIGLVALTVKRNERIVISLAERSEGGTGMTVSGNAPRRVRKAFLELKL